MRTVARRRPQLLTVRRGAHRQSVIFMHYAVLAGYRGTRRITRCACRRSLCPAQCIASHGRPPWPPGPHRGG
eukprot:1572254-Pyramimonas_sp.AAC.1